MHNISVIIPTYNRASTLLRAITSALNQTLPVSEILVCDDGSTDNSIDLIGSLNEPTVKWIACGRNGRPAIPRNKGIQQAKGEWIAFLDSDDEWMPGKIQQQFNQMQLQKTKACSANASRITENNMVAGSLHTIQQDKLELKDLATTNYVVCSSAIVHKNILLKCELFPEDANLKALEDYALWLRVNSFTPISYCATPLVRYYDFPEQSIRADENEESSQRERVFKNFYYWVNNKASNIPSTIKKLAIRQLRLEMKRSGKNIFERLFI